MTTQVLGIRHHGPGSAQAALRALESLQPDVLLVEIPADLEPQLKQIGEPGLEPPVALLAYSPKDFARSSFVPFAEFSPEWQAIRWAHARQVPVVAIDLPLAMQLAPGEERAGEPSLGGLDPSEGEEERLLRRDPLAYLAGLAGYTDRERWWEDTFERESTGEDVFEAVGLLMRQLRETALEDTPELLLREAHMRKSLRKAAKLGYQNGAVLCGAWHVPALEAWKDHTAASDNQLLRKRPKVKLDSSWIPWSYSRLASESGYRSGIASPAWYEQLFRNRAESGLQWLAKAARLLRREDLDASAAHVQEAVLLAHALTRLRGHRTPGLQELEEAARSVFTQDRSEPFQLIRRKLIIGDRLGRVAPGITKVPLLEDLQKQARSARLKKELDTTLPLEKSLDLRKPANRKASLLLHRLRLLDIPWGTPQAGSDQQTGSFSEHWKLQWKPDFAIQLVQAAVWGNTVEDAATAKAIQRGREAESLGELSRLTQEILQSDLGAALSAVLHLLEDRAAHTRDVAALLEALPLLVRIRRYGNTRKTDTGMVAHLLQTVLPRIFVGLSSLPQGIDDDEAAHQAQTLIEAHHAIFLLENPGYHQDWLRAMDKLSGQQTNHPLLRGMADRMLFDKAHRSLMETRTRMSLHLSIIEGAIHWLEGFLYGSGQLLILQPGLWSLLDQWLDGLSEEHFLNLLPVLRRTFAHFSRPEREKMLSLAEHPLSDTGSTATRERGNLDPERIQQVAPLLEDILRVNPDDPSDGSIEDPDISS